MKKMILKTPVALFALFLLAAFALSACGSAAATTAATSAAVTSAPTAAPTVAAAPGACLIGTWKLTDFSSYMNSIEQNTATSSGSTVTVTSQNFTGSSTFTFAGDGTTTLNADNFEQKFTLSTAVGGTSLDIPIALDINGKATASYTVDADKISFSNQDNSAITVTVTAAGSASPVDQSLLGSGGTVQLYQFACPDANTLTLKVIAITNQDLAPLTLTRVQ